MIQDQHSSREIDRNSGNYQTRWLAAGFEPTCFPFPTRNADLKFAALTNSSPWLGASGPQNMR